MENLNSFLNNSVSLNYSDAQISIYNFIINLIVAFILSYILKIVYEKNASTISNRKILSKNFMLLTVTTMIVITIVKSSLALSLGLVGALSIVRFRAAIKEPEELTYLFLCIAIGLGLGANQLLITIIGFIIIIVFIFLTNIFYQLFTSKSEKNNNDMLHLSIISEKNIQLKFTNINDILFEFCKIVDFKKYIEGNEINEFLFIVKLRDIKLIDDIKQKFNDIDKNIKIEIIDLNNFD